MKWPLFTWILAGGIFSMFWLLYVSIIEKEKYAKVVAQAIERRGRHRRRASTLAKT